MRNDADLAGLPMLPGCTAGMRQRSSAAARPVADLLPPDAETELAVAARHVARAHIIVAQQRERIAALKARGSCTRDHELTFGALVGTLQSLEHQARALRASAAKLAQPPRLAS
jgi:hypothetical protein